MSKLKETRQGDKQPVGFGVSAIGLNLAYSYMVNPTIYSEVDVLSGTDLGACTITSILGTAVT